MSQESGQDLKELKSRSRRDICTLLLIAALSTVVKMWKQPRCPLISEERKCGLYYNGILPSLKKEGNSGTCHHMGEP